MDTEKHTLAVSQINFVRMAVAADIQIRFTAHGGHTVMRLQLLAGGWLDDHQAIARLRAALDRLSAPELEALYAFLQTPEYESPDDVNDKRRRDRCEHGVVLAPPILEC